MNAPQGIREFPQYERRLWRVLAVLARSGYFVPPQDARDLLHDFYLDAWTGVKERFNPDLSSFTTYLSAAFYQFARRRIAKLDSWRYRLVDIEEASALPSGAPSPSEHVELVERLDAVKRALDGLPSLERQALYAYAADHRMAERELAKCAGKSRYAVRELLTNAVGRLALALKDADLDSTDSAVAFHLWREDRTPRQVAALLGLSVSEVQEARTRVATQLLASIRSFDTSRTIEGAPMQKTVEQLKAGLLVGDAEAAHKFITLHRAEFRETLENDRDFAFTEAEATFLQKHPERLGLLYEELGAGDDDDDERNELAQALAISRSNAEREIGEAFLALVENLPDRLRTWEEIFHPEHQVDRRFRDHLLVHEPTVRFGGRPAVEITRYGLTPASIQEATVSFQLLLDRVERASRKGVPAEFALGRAEGPSSGLFAQYQGDRRVFIGLAYFRAQVQGVRDLPPSVVPTLTRWLLDVATLFPYLVEDYRLDEDGDGPALTFVQDTRSSQQGFKTDYFRQWTRRRAEPDAPLRRTLTR